MKRPTTHLGNKELHSRHAVMIEGGSLPRAKVMDQTVFDRWLVCGKINLAQHKAAELLLELSSRGGMWPSAINLMGSGGGKKGSTVPFRAIGIGGMLSAVQKKFGWFHANILRVVIRHNKDVSDDALKFAAIQQSLNWISNEKMARVPNPLKKFKKV
jgi:hypothetical protein